MNEIRLQLALAKAGLASRRHAEELIVAGRVAVNGRVVTELGSRVDPVSDEVTVDGTPVLREAPAYYLMNKPKGYVTTAADPEGRETVFSLLKTTTMRLFSVGRLDYNTEGALLLTNDGELAHALMHPSRGVAKVYHAKFRGLVDKDQISLLRRGVDLPPARPLGKDGKALPTPPGSDRPERSAPAQVSVITSTGRHSWLQFILHEGKNRQIHRMAEAVGSSLLKLLRVEYAGLSLMDLPTGDYRPLQSREVLELRQSVGLRPFPTQAGPQKPKVKAEPEPEPAPRPTGRGGGQRIREEPGRDDSRRGDSRGRPAHDRPRDGGEQRDRPAFGSAGRGAPYPRRPAWSPDRPSPRAGGEQRDRPAFGTASRGAPSIRPRRPEWSQDRQREGGEQRERPAFGSSERGTTSERPSRPAWSPDRQREGGEQRERPAFGGVDRGAPSGRPGRPAWTPDRPREGGEQRDRPAFGSADRGASPGRPSRPAWSQDRPSSPREGGEQRARPAFGSAGRGAAPGRPGRPTVSQDRPREGGEQRDRPATAPAGRTDTAPRYHRPPTPRRTDSRELPHDWPPR